MSRPSRLLHKLYSFGLTRNPITRRTLVTGTLGFISVVTTEEQSARKKSAREAGTPAHWVNETGHEFTNPWPSFQKHGFKDYVSVGIVYISSIRKCTDILLQILPKMMATKPIPKDLQTRLPLIKPTWGLSAKGTLLPETKEKIKATWLGHACFLVELPVRLDGVERGARILFDPVFSARCSPSQLAGPKRITGNPIFLIRTLRRVAEHRPGKNIRTSLQYF